MTSKKEEFTFDPEWWVWKIRETFLYNEDAGSAPALRSAIHVMRDNAIRVMKASGIFENAKEPTYDKKTKSMFDDDEFNAFLKEKYDFWSDQVKREDDDGIIPPTHHFFNRDAKYPNIKHGLFGLENVLDIMRILDYLEDEINKGDKLGKIALLSMLLVCEATKIKYSDLTYARDERYKKGIGRHQQHHFMVKSKVVKIADKLWKENPKKRMSEMAKEIYNIIIKETRPVFLREDFSSRTISRWLKEAEKENKLIIPEEAKKAGRPKGS